MILRLPMVRLFGFALLASCSSEKSVTTAQQWVTLGQAQAGDVTVELATDTRLETGLTPIHIRLTGADGAPVGETPVEFEPLMTMNGGKQHSCPTIGLPELGADGAYHTAAVFQMPSSAMGTWSATVRLGSFDAGDVAATFAELEVFESGRAQVFSYQHPETSETHKFVASLNFASPPRVGLNPVVLTLHEMADMMTFAAIDDATIALDPQMPSMGHGSPGSVDPTPTSLGRYSGQLSFSMVGTWETTVTITRDGATLGSPKFTTSF